jgi:hypothetical protein
VNVQKDFWGKLSQGAKNWFAGDWSGPLEKGAHPGSHPAYDKVVREELDAFISKKKITAANPMKWEDARDFTRMMRDGKTVTGKAANANVLKDFNVEIMAAMKAKPAQEEAAILARGKSYRQNSGRYIGFAAILGVIGVLQNGFAMADGLGEIAKSPHYIKAIQSAERGDVASARTALIGTDDDFLADTHLFGQIASKFVNANPNLKDLASRLHSQLVIMFNDLALFQGQVGK